MHIGRVNVARYNVEARYVAGVLRAGRSDEAVFGLEEATHDVEGGCFADALGLHVSAGRSLVGDRGELQDGEESRGEGCGKARVHGQ